MLLPIDKVKAAILHSDQDVREAAVNYSSSSLSAKATFTLSEIMAADS